MPVNRYSTGNEFVAIPDVAAATCGIEDISFLYKFYRSAIELHGTDQEPFLQPVLSVGGRRLDLSQAVWEQERHWIPSFSLTRNGLEVRSRIYAPLGRRGFVWVMEIVSAADDLLDVEIGWKGVWQESYHALNVSKPLRGAIFGGINPRHGGVPFAEFRGIAPLFAVAFCPSEPMLLAVTSDGEPDRTIAAPGRGEVIGRGGESVRYSVSLPLSLAPGEQRTLALYVGIGLEEISAVTAAIDLEQRGWEDLYTGTISWLDAHKLSVNDDELDRLLNLNSFYNYFFSQGTTLDTEELVLVTARSSKYGMSSAYRDRDAMRWSLPAVLQVDPAQARKMMEYAFNVQLRNVGARSRFIDGVVIEPGLQLDQLCASIRALSTYVRATRDVSILFHRRIQAGINRIRQVLIAKRHPSVALYETTFHPSGDIAEYPYLTFANVLTWRAMHDLEWMYELIHDLDRSEENKLLAKQIHLAVMSHCVVDGPFGPMFAWAVDLQGNYRIHDDPLGSLQIISWLEFCAPDFSVYENTVRWIHSRENPNSFCHAPFSAPGTEQENHPHLISIANDLLAGRTDHAIDFLRRAKLDDGIACETVDENTGEAASGRAFATCAGYLAFALSCALGASVPGPEPEPSLRLYEPPPPEFRDSTF